MAVFQRAQTEPALPVEQREAYTFGIARNLCRRAVREEGRLTPLDPASPPPETRTVSGRWESAEGVQDCIKRLSPGLRKVLQATYWEGRSSLEVAQRAGLSAENVRQQLHRARGALRRCMEARLKRLQRKEWKHVGTNE